MTREPNPYAKDPALTVNKAVVMAVPSVVAEDVLDGPDVVDAQHQKNTDIHVSSADREKWDGVAETAIQEFEYSSLKHNDEAEDVMLAGFLWFPYGLDLEYGRRDVKGYTSMRIQYGSATEDADGNPLDTETQYIIRVWNMDGNIVCESYESQYYMPGRMVYFTFESIPETNSDSGPFILEFVPWDRYSDTEPSLTSPVCVRAIRNYYDMDAVYGINADGSSEDMLLIYSVRSSYNHFGDTSKHLTVEDRGRLNNLSYFESQAAKISLIDSYRGAGVEPANTNSQFDSTAIGNGATTTNQQATAVGYNSTVDGKYATAIGTDTVAAALRATAVGYNAKAKESGATALGGETTALYEGTALGARAQALGRASIAIGYNARNEDSGTIVLRTSAVSDNIRTFFYIIGAKSDLANTYEDGEACLGYVVEHIDGNIMACGTRKLSELLTNNTTFAPTSLDPDAEPPKVFMPTGILDPEPELELPEEEETPEVTQEKTETPFEKLKAKFTELLKNNKG